MLVDGQWQVENLRRDEQGNYVRPMTQFRHQLGSDEFPLEKNRYHLFISYACPWAHRTLIFRYLKDLQDYISFSAVKPYMGDDGWQFSSDDGECYGLTYLRQLYLKADAKYTGQVTVPVLWDRKKQTIVNNESAELIRMFNRVGHKESLDYYPANHQAAIDEVNDYIYNNINNGVYKVGFAGTQHAYEYAFDKLFNALDTIEQRLQQQRYLVGSQLTEADWRLFTTLIRFDAVYVLHFKCNLRRISDYPALSNYLRELYQIPGIAETVSLQQIKEHYYTSHRHINPLGIIPKGPLLDFTKPHNRGAL